MAHHHPDLDDKQTARVYLLLRVGQWIFFLDIVVLLIPNTLARSAIITATAPAIIIAGLVLLFDVRGAIGRFSHELRSRNYAFAKIAEAWPSYFWRSVGAAITIVGVTIWAVGITGLA